LSSESVTDERVRVSDVPPDSPRSAPHSTKNIENAIYAYIRAIRALGRDKINTIDIAEALSLPVSEVNRAVSALEKKGVKTLDV
jgi:hypothetical protein